MLIRTSKVDARRRLEWEMRALRDMIAKGPLTYCYPGFMGSVCERLVARGEATREASGEMPVPDWWPKDKQALRAWRAHGPKQQFRYAITDAGRARLA
jgi:hypothetical protein